MNENTNALVNPHHIEFLWEFLFRAGIIGFLVAVAIAFAASLDYLFLPNGRQIIAGTALVKLGVNLGAVVWAGSSYVLLIPNLGHLFRSRSHDSTDRVAWFFFLILFPFVSCYFYFRKWVRRNSLAEET